MITITANLTAWGAFTERVAALPDDLDTVIDTSSEKWGKSVTDAMKANHEANAHASERFETQTGTLVASIDYTVLPEVDNGHVTTHPISVRATAPYAWDVEIGVPGQSRPYPFFWKEIMSGDHTAMVQTDLTTGTNNLLASAADRL
jgi:hypothetical protein